MPSHRTSPPGALLVRLLVASVLLGVAGCVPEAGEPLSWAEATGATGVAGQPATATVALAEFEGYADPATGAFSVQVVRSFDPYTQLQAIYEGNGMRTVGQALPRSTPAPWCTGIVVNDGALGTNPPNTFELWTDQASIASALPGAPTVPAACNVGDTSLYSIDGVFCATVRAMNFHGVPWSDVATQIHLFGGDAATQGGYAYPYGTGLQTVDGTTGDPLPSYTNLPDPGDELGIWGYGTLGASGGQATRTWTFRNGSAGSFRFRGRVLGRVAEDCATADVNEDCDPAGRGDNACRLYTEGEACDDDLDCVSYLCTAGACAADCAAGLWGAACQECPGGWSSPCSDQGVCNDGVSGDGSCTCDTDYYSADCSVQCAPDETWTQATGCVPRECPAGLHDYFGDGLTCIDAQLASSGKNHTCAIKQDHSLWCWGRNDSGQLGIGSAVSRVNPTQVGIGTDWVWVSTGAFHTCGLRYNGDMYCWGSPSSGKLGDGQTTTARTSPLQVGAGVQWRAVTTGEAHTCAIDADEGLWCWGAASYGRLGNGETATDRSAPVRIGTDTGWSAVSAGGSHACGIREGALMCWGLDNLGQLGHGGSRVDQSVPTQVGAEIDWTAVSSGQYHSCGIRSGLVFCWGTDTAGQLGNGDVVTADQQAPVLVDGGYSDWVAVSAGEERTYGIRAGQLWRWGGGYSGQFDGADPTVDRPSPERVGSADDWISVSAGGYHSSAVRADELWWWGYDYMDQPVPVVLGVVSDWTHVGVGAHHSCGVRAGQLWCWGYDGNYQLGDGGRNADQASPARVGTWTNWSLVTSGGNHSCGIRAGGYLYCWGRDSNGQLGDSASLSTKSAPARVGTGTDWTTVSAGSDHTCGIRAGELYCWGRDNYGQVGNGGVVVDESWPQPVRVGVDTGWTVVSAGATHTCGIRAGELYCWGRDAYGQIGDGGVILSESFADPVRVGLDSDWSAVSAGTTHTCGVRAGELYCWGRDNAGQLGNNSSSSASLAAPMRSGSASDWTGVTAGGSHTCGIRTSLGLFCWGSDSYGQVGDSTALSTRHDPAAVGTVASSTSVSAGGSHSCAIDAGAMYCWGQAVYGKLGLASTTLILDLID